MSAIRSTVLGVWCSRRRRLELELDDLRRIASRNFRLSTLILENLMSTNEDLAGIGANLDEALGELSGLPAEIAELIAAAGDQADPALVASLQAKAAALANIVPNAPAEPETPAEPEAPVEDVPADDAPVTEDGGDVVADEPTA